MTGLFAIGSSNEKMILVFLLKICLLLGWGGNLAKRRTFTLAFQQFRCDFGAFLSG